jgi:predicted nucleic acid-binding protein
LIVVDTSVWINVLNGVDSPGAARCRELIADEAPVALTDVVLTEALQGFSDPGQADRVEARLREFPILKLEAIEDFVLAADLFRSARRAGVSVPTLDCLIAAPCVRTDAPILHADADFDRLASCTPLRVFES